MTGPRKPRHIAVIGAGVSGLTAAYLLQRQADVTLFETDDRLGGHAHTHEVRDGFRTLPVDSGFIVHNNDTYPMLRRLFYELGVRTRPSQMSMSVRCEGCGLTYAGGRGFSGLCADPATAMRPRYLSMLARIPGFHRSARALLAARPATPEPTLGEFLAERRYPAYFNHHFVIPLVSAVWSCGPGEVMKYPARYLFTFLARHGMLTIGSSPTWRTVEGGSRCYVEAATKGLTAVYTSTPVRAVHRHAEGVDVRDDSDTVTTFAAVVVATHADQALRLLVDATPQECAVLGAFTYSRNETLLHRDGSVLPRRRAAAAGWNYVLPTCAPGSRPVLVSYDVNRLQRLHAARPLVVTLNGTERVRPDLVLAHMTYEHPIYTSEALAAQRRLPALTDGRTAFAGAYHGWGFHEDGCRSAVTAAQALGVSW
jgi:uncharacterized protein